MSFGEGGEYLFDRLTDESLKFFEKNKHQPFLLYFSHYAVHTPIQTKPEIAEKYKIKAGSLAQAKPDFTEERESFIKMNQDSPEYAGMVKSTDESVGRAGAIHGSQTRTSTRAGPSLSINWIITVASRRCICLPSRLQV